MPKTELRSEVEINAPVAHVYRVLTDFRQYEIWNPFLTSVSGELRLGQKLSLELSLPEGSAYTLTPQVTRVAENAELRWSGHLWFPALLELEHAFVLSELEQNVTRVAQIQIFSGFFLRFIGGSLTLAARGSIYMNQALKKRAESTR